MFRHVANPQRGNLIGWTTIDHLPAEKHATFTRRQQPDDRLKRRRLACAVAAEQCRDAATRHAQRHAFQNVELADEGVDRFDLKEIVG